MRRIPVPQGTGMRIENNLDDISDLSIYIHTLNFTFNTVSHLAIGEISAINWQERIYNAFIILLGTFIYAFVFGNVASIIADFAPQMFFFKFHKLFEDVMSSLKRDAVPYALIDKIKDYFDYVWANSKGISYEEILGGLPK
jgi:potassium voltage-gated channel Eag-related subfamily H protein 5